MVKYDLTTAWQEVYNSVDDDRRVLFSAGSPDAARRGIYISLGRNKQEDIILCMHSNAMLDITVKGGIPVFAKMVAGTAKMCVYRF